MPTGLGQRALDAHWWSEPGTPISEDRLPVERLAPKLVAPLPSLCTPRPLTEGARSARHTASSTGAATCLMCSGRACTVRTFSFRIADLRAWSATCFSARYLTPMSRNRFALPPSAEGVFPFTTCSQHVAISMWPIPVVYLTVRVERPPPGGL